MEKKPRRQFISWLMAVLLPAAGWAADFDLTEARRLEATGDFKQAAALLQGVIKETNTPPLERKQLEFESDRLERIRLDYPLTRVELEEKLKASVRAMSADEFEKWCAEKWFDVRMIDGEERFMISSVANLFWRHPELNSRRLKPKADSFQKAMWEECVAIKQATAREHSPFVLPQTFDVTMTVTVNANTVSNGEIIRAWLPVPRQYPYQSGFEILSSSSPVKQLAAETSPIRSAYFEQVAASNAPSIFQLHYHYTTKGVWFDVDPETVSVFDGKDSAIARFTQEAPHVTFTPELKKLSQKILGDEKNSARQAKKFYDWIGANIKYSFATEYSTIPNISEYCRAHGYGDCGQEALLFITLCRLNGIPARWQSGWDTFSGAKDIHDWTEIYLAPYGWLPVDPYMSIFTTQYATRLTPEQSRELHDFYFGGRGHWRMAANGDHEQELQPTKNGFRSDDVDFQRGELEAHGMNIYFNHYGYELEATPIFPVNGHKP